MGNLIFKSVIMIAAAVCCLGCEKEDEKGDVRDAYTGAFRIREQATVEGVVVEDSYNISVGSYIRFSVLLTAQIAGQINFTCKGPRQ
jgi:hypothetical protein